MTRRRKARKLSPRKPVSRRDLKRRGSIPAAVAPPQVDPMTKVVMLTPIAQAIMQVYNIRTMPAHRAQAVQLPSASGIRLGAFFY